MAYGDFDLESVKEKFGLTLRADQILFPNPPAVPPTPILRQLLDEWVTVSLAVNTERSRAEGIIAPILMDVVRQTGKRVALFTGSTFDVDRSLGLNGVCDYIIADSNIHFWISRPVFAVIEAKKDDVITGLGQCAAAVYAAQMFNVRKEGHAPARLYGAVTSGNVWKFLRVERDRIDIDATEYNLSQLDQILGIFLKIILPQPT